MAMILQLIVSLCTLISITESSDVFRSVGSSVQLDIQHPVPKFDELIWVFNRVNNVLKYYSEFKKTKQTPGYEGRVEFNEETYSLTLKNLQKTDSGLYEAKASGDEVTVVAEYRLSVLDPVEAPVLNLQLSNDTCNITLTCRGHDLSINSSCYKETCEEKEVTSPGGVTLSLSVSGSTIICNHSNPVSWKTDVLEMKELERLCADEGSVSPSAGVSVCLLKTVLYSIILTLMLSAVITVHIREKLTKSS
ncbi:SLAM family member 5-like isoform X2 [Colossoma macropomum]|uniref:SLAM family member 5-like isoform X2 n=1 Tax=Colossoma macropomum TaxID=42526 RepID=UPI0018640AF3|nr:SLAM family member 5-like isoform X2 [Colossoma macropomum]